MGAGVGVHLAKTAGLGPWLVVCAGCMLWGITLLEACAVETVVTEC